MKPREWIIALVALLLGRRRPQQADADTSASESDEGRSPEERLPGSERFVPAGDPDRAAENLVLACLALATAAAIGFIVVYAAFKAGRIPNELLGISLGVSLASIGGALTILAKRLVVTEELEEDYPTANPQAQQDLLQIVHDSGSRITRKRLLLGAGATAGGALAVAALTPALSVGPIWDTAPLEETPWRRGRRLVDENDVPIAADDIEEQTFYTGFPEKADKEELGSSLVIVRLDPAKIRLPPGRDGWAPRGILAYSKICTHAGCAIELYRKPTFPTVEPEPALVCPCHYSTFNPADGAQVIYGPAGRPLPQLPLMIDSDGNLRAAGNFSARVGPGWWAVRFKATSE